MRGPRLTGVGVGPGDPELLTVKGLRALEAADMVFVPVADMAPEQPGALGAGGYAEGVAGVYLDPDRLRRLPFTLGGDPQVRDRTWQAAAEQVAAAVRDGAHAAFATIGDPNLYSTFSTLSTRVRELVPGVTVDTVPGITALQDLAARSGTVLAEANERVALLPFTTGAERLSEALAAYDTVVTYKGGRYLPEVTRVIAEAERLDEAVFGARLGLAGEHITRLDDDGDMPEQAHYLSTVIVAPRRRGRGEGETP